MLDVGCRGGKGVADARAMTNRGVGVEMSAHVLNLELQLLLCPLVCALELLLANASGFDGVGPQ